MAIYNVAATRVSFTLVRRCGLIGQRPTCRLTRVHRGIARQVGGCNGALRDRFAICG